MRTKPLLLEEGVVAGLYIDVFTRGLQNKFNNQKLACMFYKLFRLQEHNALLDIHARSYIEN
jgi:hypothetical protein